MGKDTNKFRNTEQGAILLVALFTVAILSILGALAALMATNYETQINIKGDRFKAKYLAEAAVYRSIWELSYERYEGSERGIVFDGNISLSEDDEINFYDYRESVDVAQNKSSNPTKLKGKISSNYYSSDNIIRAEGEVNEIKQALVVQIERN